jgi:predicted RNA-binding Zn ribbon-like protein
VVLDRAARPLYPHCCSDTSYTGVVTALLDDLSDHELAFWFNGGSLSLDFTVTVGERLLRSFERLRTPSDLGRWFVEAGLLEEPPLVRPRELRGARELREAIYRSAKLVGQAAPDAADVELINRWALLAPLAPQLAPDGRHVSWVAERPTQAALSLIARDAIELFSGPWAGRIRECAAPDCAVLFVDRSRPGRRRWCSMRECGNRIKTAAYRRRRTTATDRQA